MSKLLIIKHTSLTPVNSDKSVLAVKKYITPYIQTTIPVFCITAVKQQLYVNVTFNSQGGNIINNSVFTLGKTYGKLPIPVKDNQRFVGWFTDPSYGKQVTADMIVENIDTLYAQWETLSFAVNADNPAVSGKRSFLKSFFKKFF